MSNKILAVFLVAALLLVTFVAANDASKFTLADALKGYVFDHFGHVDPQRSSSSNNKIFKYKKKMI